MCEKRKRKHSKKGNNQVHLEIGKNKKIDLGCDVFSVKYDIQIHKGQMYTYLSSYTFEKFVNVFSVSRIDLCPFLDEMVMKLMYFFCYITVSIFHVNETDLQGPRIGWNPHKKNLGS